MKNFKGILLCFFVLILLCSCKTQSTNKINIDTNETSEKALDLENLDDGEYRISSLPGIIKVGDNYNVYSTDNDFTEEMCLAQGVEYEKMQKYVEVSKSMSGIDMHIIPADQNMAKSDFWIEIKVKENKDYGIDNFKALDDKDFKTYAYALIKGFGLSIDSDLNYSTYDNKDAKYIVFDCKIINYERRYATIINGKMVYFIAQSKRGTISDIEDSEIKTIIDSLKY